MHATRAAVEEGIVPGGGAAFCAVSRPWRSSSFTTMRHRREHREASAGGATRQIAKNAGHEGAVVVGRVRDSKDENFGFNAETGEYADLIKAGVIDPAKVTRLHYRTLRLSLR